MFAPIDGIVVLSALAFQKARSRNSTKSGRGTQEMGGTNFERIEKKALIMQQDCSLIWRDIYIVGIWCF